MGAAAGMLSRQYRMHPTIGTLISEAYYEGKLENCTVDGEGKPKAEVVLPVIEPQSVVGKGIVWLDTPTAMQDPRARERGPQEGRPRYTNPFEVAVLKGFIESLVLSPTEKILKLAVLAPYNQQVSLIRDRLTGIRLPSGVVMKEELRSRGAESQTRLAHTVDSFQGNEADIIIVSLVRNNSGNRRRPLGFLEDPERMNVLLSRAQRLLVLVGSWEFFSSQVAPFSLEDRSRRERWHLKKVMTLLREWFTTGEAALVDGRSLMDEDLYDRLNSD